MRVLDTDALRLVAGALGVGNPASLTEQTTFDDSVLQQVLDVSGLIRRARIPVGADGIYLAVMENQHAAVDSVESVEVDPYNPGTITCGLNNYLGALYPNPVPQDLDAWLLRVHAFMPTGAAANFDGAALALQIPKSSAGFGCSSFAPTTTSLRIMSWDGTSTILGGTPSLTQVGSGLTNLPLAMRLPRGCKLQWFSKNQNNLAIDVQVRMLVGLAPKGLGQDFAY